jgi:hypothetical protein
MLSFLLNTFIFALIIGSLFTGVHYLYLKIMNQDDEYTRNDYIILFIKYYVVSLASLMGYEFLNNYLKSDNKSSNDSGKNVMFGGSNVVNTTSFSNSTNSASVPVSNSVNTTAFKPVSNNTQGSRPNVAQPNYESFKTGRPTF